MAIILVLLIVAMATSLAAFMALQQNLWQRQVASQQARAQARQIGLAGIDWARAVLADDGRSSNIDHPREIWSLRLPAMPVEGGEVIGAIEDRQGLLNLNNLPANMSQFQRLLALLGLPGELAPALADWIDADSEAQAGGAEDGYYLALAQPYRTANRGLSELGELVRVKGFDGRIIEKLRTFVTVLPGSGTPVNVNFAPAEVLSALVEGLNLADARMLVQQRQVQPFKDHADFRRHLPQEGRVTVVDGDISVKTDYFWVTGRARIDTAQVVTQALLYRSSTWPTVVWQSVQ